MLLDALKKNRSLQDGPLAGVMATAAVTYVLVHPGHRPLDAVGVLLLGGAYTVLTWRRRCPAVVMVAVVVLLVPYNLLEYRNEAGIPAGLLALFTLSALGGRRQAVLSGLGVLAVVLTGMTVVKSGVHFGAPQLGAIGWTADAVIAGQAWRSHRAYVAAIIDRAERAERTREEEVRRRVAEERLRIARDLHDLLSHSITVIGVRAGAAAHLVGGDRPIDRAELAEALGDIAGTCRTARKELRATLAVLRAADGGAGEPLPELDRVGELADVARAAGLEVTLDERGDTEISAEVGVAAYRIVQEALTNVIKHADARSVRISLCRADDRLLVTVEDDGRGPAAGDGPRGFGLVGMTERARSVGGTLRAGRGPRGGFVVGAELPLDAGHGG
ncbi:sensor histidine kinase [Actinomadura miaoliensis]|uniref:histidine kinase n=1 Tax=Actinomadura miaoliensis TaxID=430685 RepID=A0ABP7W6D6_9ACTN